MSVINERNSSKVIDQKERVAKSITINCQKFEKSPNLMKCTWLFSNIMQQVKCGPCVPTVSSHSNKWLITEICNQQDSIFSLNSMESNKNNGKKEKLMRSLFVPKSDVQFTYDSYKVVICLEFNSSSYFVRHDGSRSADDILFSLESTLHQILSNPLKSKKHISIVHHNSELNISYFLWHGFILELKDIDTLLITIRKTLKEIESKYRQGVNSISKTLFNSTSNLSLTSAIQCILYYMKIHFTIKDSCPTALLITSGKP